MTTPNPRALELARKTEDALSSLIFIANEHGLAFCRDDGEFDEEGEKECRDNMRSVVNSIIAAALAERDAEIERLRALLDEAQDVLCSGMTLTPDAHLEFMGRINEALGTALAHKGWR